MEIRFISFRSDFGFFCYFIFAISQISQRKFLTRFSPINSSYFKGINYLIILRERECIEAKLAIVKVVCFQIETRFLYFGNYKFALPKICKIISLDQTLKF